MYLLDTNALLIVLRKEIAEGALTESSMELLETEQKLYVSIVSLWEMAIKVKIKKLELNATLSEIEEECFRHGIVILPMKTSYMDKMVELPLMKDHADPFDRTIMSTALVEGMTLISADTKMRRKEYGLDIIW